MPSYSLLICALVSITTAQLTLSTTPQPLEEDVELPFFAPVSTTPIESSLPIVYQATPSASPSTSALVLLTQTTERSLTQTPTPTQTSTSPSSPSQDDDETSFRDVTSESGITQPTSSEQFGGATIADIDSDGHYDFLLTYHNHSPLRLFFGTSNGTFTPSSFSLRSDIHGVSVAARSARTNEKIIAVSVGGGRGANLRPPFIFLAKPDRSISDITNQFGFGQAASRGRVPVFAHLSLQTRLERRRNGGGPDLLVVNFLGRNSDLEHFAYQNIRGNYSLRSVPGLAKVNEVRAIVTDIDNDGVMEVVHFSVFRVFSMIDSFSFEDITRFVWFDFRDLRRSVSAVTELDYNNDGLMDLYIARARSHLVTPRGPPAVPEHGDVLLRNVGGFFEEVSATAGIPTDTDSMGVTAEDFDNNGYVDVLVTTFQGPDVLLLNQGDGTFRRVDPRTTKPATTRGANVMAVDYDLDGRVDYIVGHGLRREFTGTYRLMRNEMELTAASNFLLVRVGNEATLACTSLNAFVTVFIQRGKRMVRRVGGRGAQAGGQSYIDTVHFGLGSATIVRRVTVRWTTGAFQGKQQVMANQKISFGRFI